MCSSCSTCRREAKTGPRRRTWSETVAAFPEERVLYDREDPAWMLSFSSITYRAEAESVGQGVAM
jgi:hypothetical protein